MGGKYKYYKIGDIVRNEMVWGDILFVIERFIGNDYAPEAVVHFRNKPLDNGHKCNFGIEEMKLVNSPNRPFKKLKIEVLRKILKTGNEEAKREFIIRFQK
jgi:hypothetical protein